MISFQFSFREQIFDAEFVKGQIEYNRETVASYLQMDPSRLPGRVTAVTANAILPPDRLDRFRPWHAAAQDTVFDLIKADNEFD
jgi:hypothetical protein